MREETRPWGRFEVLHESENNWFKRIIIYPGQSLSYQYHIARTEYWLPETDGVWAEIRGRTLELRKRRMVAVAIHPRVEHRLFNPGTESVSVLEWAIGYPREDDIVRLKDDYGRV